MKWKAFLSGLESAALTGALTGFTQAFVSGQKIGTGTLLTGAVGALAGVIAFLKQSPLAPSLPEVK